MSWSSFWIMLALLLASAGSLHAQAEISALALDSEPVEETEDLLLSRFEDLSEVTHLELGVGLEFGDELSSLTGALDVELECGEQTVLRFSGDFQVLLNSPEEADCAVDLLSGSLDVLTDEPTEVDAAGVVLGSEGTQYTVELTVQDGEPDRTVFVFDGQVKIRSGDEEQDVESGSTWSRIRGRTAWGKTSDEDVDRVAGRYARFDAAKSVVEGKISDRKASIERFKALHRDVLKSPEDTDKRVELAKEQLEYDREGLAAYNLKRVGLNTSEQLESHGVDQKVLPRILKGKITQRKTSVKALKKRRFQAAKKTGPFDLIAEQRFDEALVLLRDRERSAPDSKVYYGLALALRGLEGARSRDAYAYAERALRSSGEDEKLSAEEIETCNRIRQAYERAPAYRRP